MEIASTQDSDPRKRQIQEIVEDVVHRRAAGEEITDEQVMEQHPDLMPELEAKLNALHRITDAIDQSDHGNVSDYVPGDRIAHFRIERVLGRGHFGCGTAR